MELAMLTVVSGGAGVAGESKPPPPARGALFLAIVLLSTVSVPDEAPRMAPPLPAEEFPVKVLLVIVTLPCAKLIPPPPTDAAVDVLELNVDRKTFNVPDWR